MAELTGTRTARVLGTDSPATRTIVPVGESALILGVYVACDVINNVVSIQTGDGALNLLVLNCRINNTEKIEVPFLVDNGLRVTGTGNPAFITVIFRPAV